MGNTIFAIALLTLVGCATTRTTTAELTSGDATLKIWMRGGDAHSDVLVLINGGPGLSHQSMDPLQAKLASKKLRVVTYDQRGVGASVAPGTGKLQPSDHLDDLDAIRKFLQRARIHLLGHSFGGMIALAYFDRQPENVSSLVLVSPGVSNAEAMQEGGKHLGERVAKLQREHIIPDPLPTTCAARILAMMPAYFADPHMPVPEVLAHRQCDATDRSSILFDMIDVPYANGVGKAVVPAMVVYGDSEPFGPAPSLAAAAALGPAKPKVVQLPHCGHMGWLECRDEFMNAVEPFVKANTR